MPHSIPFFDVRFQAAGSISLLSIFFLGLILLLEVCTSNGGDRVGIRMRVAATTIQIQIQCAQFDSREEM